MAGGGGRPGGERVDPPTERTDARVSGAVALSRGPGAAVDAVARRRVGAVFGASLEEGTYLRAALQSARAAAVARPALLARSARALANDLRPQFLQHQRHDGH